MLLTTVGAWYLKEPMLPWGSAFPPEISSIKSSISSSALAPSCEDRLAFAALWECELRNSSPNLGVREVPFGPPLLPNAESSSSSQPLLCPALCYAWNVLATLGAACGCLIYEEVKLPHASSPRWMVCAPVPWTSVLLKTAEFWCY